MIDFFRRLWEKLEKPIMELTAHFLLSMVTIAFISLTDLALREARLAARPMPFFGMPLSDWLFDIDIVTASLIIMLGVFNALKEML